MIKLYDFTPSGSCYKVRLMLNILGLDYETIPVNFYPVREHRQPDFLGINPLGQLPVLLDEDVCLRDAQAILGYLAAKYDKVGTWFPQEPEALGNVMMWLSFAGNEIMNASAARLHDLFGYPFDIGKLRTSAHQAFRVLDDHLTKREFCDAHWLVGDRPTIADIACFPYVALSGEGGIPLNDYHAIRRWLDCVRGIEGFINMPGIEQLDPTT